VRDVRDVQSRLDLMDALLSRASNWTVSRAVLSTALREHILEITKIRMTTGYSPVLQATDVRLTKAIARYQFAGDAESVTALHDRLRDYREAALATWFNHMPLPLVGDLPFVPRPQSASLGLSAA
jgi:hypothetical protein